MIARVFINRHIITANKKKSRETGQIYDDPAIAIRTYKGSIYAKKIEFTQPCRLVQDAENPICSGATIWIETEFESIKILD